MKRLLPILSLLISFFSCSFSDDEPVTPPVVYEPPIAMGSTARRSCLLYVVADNDINSYLQEDLKEVLKGAAGVPADCYMLAYVDDYKSPRIVRYFNDNGVGAAETVHTFEGEMASCDTADMRRVLDWVQYNFPAERMDLIMSSHASGWLYDDNRYPSLYSFGDDWAREDADAYRRMNIDELAALLQKMPQKYERLFFDACFMQCVESAYTLRNSVDWIIASPAEVPGDGAPYDVLTPLFFNENAGVQGIMEAYKAAYLGSGTGVVLSAVRCSELEALASVVYDIAVDYLNPSMAPRYEGLFAYLPGGTGKFPNYYDMNSVMLKYLLSYDKYTAFSEAFSAAVPYACANDMWVSDVIKEEIYLAASWCGVSMYLPKNGILFPRNFNKEFSYCEWYDAAGWREAGW